LRRVLAAQQLGITDVPTMVARGWTLAQIQAYRLTDNQLALNAGWDRELLGLELGELKLGGFDLALTGFGELELSDLVDGKGLGDGGDASQQIVPESWAVIVECKNEGDQVDLIQRLQAEGRNVRGSIG
jgi:ParB-like chromosome segregation protein Spo0J